MRYYLGLLFDDGSEEPPECAVPGYARVPVEAEQDPALGYALLGGEITDERGTVERRVTIDFAESVDVLDHFPALFTDPHGGKPVYVFAKPRDGVCDYSS